VRVENRFVAAVARVLIPFFSDTMDRRLGHVLRLTARVAEWAADHPEEFCPWLARQDVTPFRRARLLEAASGCRRML
jgi:hypothetical protein